MVTAFVWLFYDMRRGKIKGRAVRCILAKIWINIFLFSYFPCDPPYVTDDLREAGAFKASMDQLKTEMEALQKKMMNSVPFYSSRYKVT